MASRKKAAADAALAITVRYDGPNDLLDVTQDGVTIARGETGSISVEAAQILLACDEADVTVIDGDVPAAWPQSHRKLDTVAERLGVTWPEPQNGQPPLDIAAKIEALEAAGFTPDGNQQKAAPADSGPKGTNDDKEG